MEARLALLLWGGNNINIGDRVFVKFNAGGSRSTIVEDIYKSIHAPYEIRIRFVDSAPNKSFGISEILSIEEEL